MFNILGQHCTDITFLNVRKCHSITENSLIDLMMQCKKVRVVCSDVATTHQRLVVAFESEWVIQAAQHWIE